MTQNGIITLLSDAARKHPAIDMSITPSKTTLSVYVVLRQDNVESCFRISDHRPNHKKPIANLVIGHRTTTEHIKRFIENRFIAFGHKKVDAIFSCLN